MVMFEENRCKLVYKGDMKWDIVFSYGEIVECSIHLNLDGEWIPIYYDSIHANNTFVGWRGPMMLWDKLKEMPMVMWEVHD